MMSFPASAPSASRFMALPGSDACGNATVMVRQDAPLPVPHGSGRPWLPGNWSAEVIRVAEVGRSRVTVMGYCPITVTRLTCVVGMDRLHAGQLERR